MRAVANSDSVSSDNLSDTTTIQIAPLTTLLGQRESRKDQELMSGAKERQTAIHL